MQETARLAGFFAAHGIWSVSAGDKLVPLMGYEHADGDRAMARFADDDPGISALTGQEALESNEFAATRAALVVEGFIHLAATPRIDALIVRAVSYFPERSAMAVAVPYRPNTDSDGFAVHRPRFLGFDNVEREEFLKIADAFHEGVSSHEEAAEVWHTALDESI
ncbi:hypothetical protein [Catenuloplanes atrovinosus]|uniref:Uncharacterized protein n=1 Tax=Catenuloplanes atrovinosus TaxID=137266 RepID=A0AAE3YJJ7_9ACTN|nr:hypothetical protein [Catenuloplanes atrovinosus]MDR7273677.1 hypothetical protein [Catenuloplanes atrovinosus]